MSDNGLRTDWMLTGSGSNDQHQAQNYKHLTTCNVK